MIYSMTSDTVKPERHSTTEVNGIKLKDRVCLTI